MDSWNSSIKGSFIGKEFFQFRDLKPANILMKGNTVKIADFGLAKKVVSDLFHHKNTEGLGTPAYKSP
jgi:serine/threonine protein kinase